MPRFITYDLLLDHYLLILVIDYCSDSIGLAPVQPHHGEDTLEVTHNHIPIKFVFTL